MHTSIVAASLLSVLALSVAGCGGSSPDPQAETEPVVTNVVTGDTKQYFGATIKTWANLMTEEVGVTVPISAITASPVKPPRGATPDKPIEGHSVRLQMPLEAREATVLDHVDIKYVIAGHPPEVYGVPHFDIHFYGIREDEQMAVNCTDTTAVAPERLPPNHLLAKAGLPPEGECVPRMGLRAVDLASPELDPENPKPFEKTMILGYYGGRLTFLEPMVARELLLSKQDFMLPIPRPQIIGRQALYPRKFRAVFDEATQSYNFILSDFEEVR